MAGEGYSLGELLSAKLEWTSEELHPFEAVCLFREAIMWVGGYRRDASAWLELLVDEDGDVGDDEQAQNVQALFHDLVTVDDILADALRYWLEVLVAQQILDAGDSGVPPDVVHARMQFAYAHGPAKLDTHAGDEWRRDTMHRDAPCN